MSREAQLRRLCKAKLKNREKVGTPETHKRFG
jgi:hypothetical protein